MYESQRNVILAKIGTEPMKAIPLFQFTQCKQYTKNTMNT